MIGQRGFHGELASSDPNRQLILTTSSLSFSKMINLYRLQNIKDHSHIKE